MAQGRFFKEQIATLSKVGVGTITPSESIETTGNIKLADNGQIKLGDSSDLKIYHNGANNGFIQNTSSHLYLESDNIILRNNGGSENLAKFLGDGGVELFFNNVVKLQTVTGGVTVSGELGASSIDVSGNLTIGGIPTAPTASAGTNTTQLATTAFVTTAVGGSTSLSGLTDVTISNIDNGEFLQYDSSASKWINLSATDAGILPLAGGTMTGNIVLNDDVKAFFGTSSDGLEIYHDGSNSTIKDSGTGVLNIQGSTQVNIGGVNGQNGVQYIEGGAVRLRHNNVVKLDTTSAGVLITGDLTVGDGHFIGDDSFDNLTLISSSGENVVIASANDIYLKTDASGGGTGTNRLVINETGATFDGTVTGKSFHQDTQVNSTFYGATFDSDVTVASSLILHQAGNFNYISSQDASKDLIVRNTGSGKDMVFQVTAGGTAELLRLRGVSSKEIVAAGNFEIRNGSSARHIYLYETYTDTSNYERSFFKHASSFLEIGTEALGTGTASGIKVRTTGVTALSIAAGGLVTVESRNSASSTNILSVGGSNNGYMSVRHVEGKNSSSNAYGPIYINHLSNNNVFLASGGGNVGIGQTSSPDAWLAVVKDNDNSGDQFLVADSEGASAAVRTYTHGGSPAGLILNHYYAVAGSSNEYMRYADFVANVGNGAGTTMRFITKNAANTYSTTVIDNDGNVGIGDNSPDYALTVKSSGADILLYDTADNGNARLFIRAGGASGNSQIFFGDAADIDAGKIRYRHSGNSFAFETNGSERMRIDSSGRVGLNEIGMSSYDGDADDLVIKTGGNTGITLRTSSTGTGSIFFADGISGAERYQGTIRYFHNGNVMTFGTSATERMRINSNGNIGINYTSAAPHPLSVKGTISRLNSSGIQVINLGTTSDHAQLILNQSGGVTRIAFNTGGADSYINAGDFGLGTTIPQSKFHVSGGDIRIDNNQQYLAETAAGGTIGVAKMDGSDNLLIGDGNLKIDVTGTTARLIIDSSGNTTLAGDLTVQGDISTTGTFTIIDTDVSTTEQLLVTNDGTGPAAIINQKGVQPVIDFQDDGTSVFYIKNGGNVGLGNTNPSARLTVRVDGNANVDQLRVENTSGRLFSVDNEGDVKVHGNLAMQDNAKVISTRKLSARDSNGLLLTEDGGTTGISINDSGNTTIQGTLTMASNGTGNSASSQEIIFYGTNSGGSQIDQATIFSTKYHYNTNAGDLVFKTGNTSGTQSERMRINGVGNVGIGIDLPSSKFHLSTSAISQQGTPVTAITKTIATTSIGAKLSFTNAHNANGNLIGGISMGNTGEEFAGLYAVDGGASAATHLAFFTGNTTATTEAMRILSDGKVGIGTTSPAAPLSLVGVNGGSWNDGLIIDDPSGWAATVYKRSNSPKMFTGLYSGNDNYIWMSTGYSNSGTTITAPRADAVLMARPGTDDLQIYLETHFGNRIGVGTTSPAAILDIVDSQTLSGSARASIQTTATSTATSSQSSGMYAIQNYFNLTGTSGSFQNSAHQQVMTTVSSTGTSTNLKNHVSRVHTSGSGQINNVSHYNIHTELDGNGTINKWIGYGIADGTLSSFTNTGHTITNTYGLYIGDITSGTQTNTPFGVYQASTDMINYFGGNVGIGTASPSSMSSSNARRLVVGSGSGAEGITIYSGNTNGGYLYFADGTSGDASYRGAIQYSHSTDALSLHTAGTATRMIVTSGGIVGIGVTNPQVQFFNNLVVGDNLSGDKGITIRSNNAARGVLAFSDTDAADSGRYAGFISYNHSDNSMRFHTLAGNEHLTILSGGNVGVGNNNPTQAKLQVSGGSVLIDAYNATGTHGLFFRSGFVSSNQYNLSITCHNDGDGSPDALDINAFDGIYFNTGAGTRNNRAFINSSGKFCINQGDTSSDYLQVTGASGLYAARFNGSATGGNSWGLRVRAGTNASDINFLAENTSGVDLFRINGNGNVGIGNVNPTSKLYVYSGAFSSGEGEIRNDARVNRNYKLALGTTTKYIGTVQMNGNGDSSGFHVRIYDGQNKNWREVNVVVQNSGGTNFPKVTVEGGGDDLNINVDLAYVNRSGAAQKTDFYLVPTASKSFTQLIFIDGYIERDTGHSSTSSTNINLDTAVGIYKAATDDSSKIGIGTNNPSEKLHVLGNAVITGSLDVQSQIVAPNAPTNLSLSVVGETINVTFTASNTSNISAYLVYSSVDGGDYGLISIIPPDDFAATMSIIDSAFTVTGTQAYRVYAIKSGKMSSALTGNISYTVSSAEPTNLSVVAMNNAFYIQYDPPSSNSRFVTTYKIFKHEHATQNSLDRTQASEIYSGMNKSYMYQISGANNTNFHQFWVETIIAT